jgi:hypothetical protein
MRPDYRTEFGCISNRRAPVQFSSNIEESIRFPEQS